MRRTARRSATTTAAAGSTGRSRARSPPSSARPALQRRHRMAARRSGTGDPRGAARSRRSTTTPISRTASPISIRWIEWIRAIARPRRSCRAAGSRSSRPIPRRWAAVAEARHVLAAAMRPVSSIRSRGHATTAAQLTDDRPNAPPPPVHGRSTSMSASARRGHAARSSLPR